MEDCRKVDRKYIITGSIFLMRVQNDKKCKKILNIRIHSGRMKLIRGR